MCYAIIIIYSYGHHFILFLCCLFQSKTDLQASNTGKEEHTEMQINQSVLLVKKQIHAGQIKNMKENKYFTTRNHPKILGPLTPFLELHQSQLFLMFILPIDKKVYVSGEI